MSERDPYASLAAAESTSLDEAARARIRERVRRDGPHIVARARTVRTVTRASAVGLSLALVASVAVWWRPRPGQRACESFAAETSPSLERGADSQRLELARARFVASTDAQLSVSTLESCRTVLALSSGRLVVHARELGGGELSVETPAGTVTVHGTVFSVEPSKGGLTVEVAEGVVEVRPKNEAPRRLLAGQRYSNVDHAGATLDPGARARVWAVKTDPGQAVAALPTPELEAPETSAEDAPEVAVGLDDEAGAEAVSPEHKRERRGTRARNRAAARRAEKNAVPEAPDETQAEPEVEAALPKSGEMAPSRSWGPAPVPAPIESAEDLVKRGDELRRAGDPSGASAAYRRAGGLSGPTAEAAWLALARLELSLGKGQAAQAALLERKSRFPRGQLAVESAWIMVRALDASGQREAAVKEAHRIVDTWPNSPQASAANKWLGETTRP